MALSRTRAKKMPALILSRMEARPPMLAWVIQGVRRKWALGLSAESWTVQAKSGGGSEASWLPCMA